MPQRRGAMSRRLPSSRPHDRARGLRRVLRADRLLPQLLLLAVMTPILVFAFAAYRDWRNIEAEASDRIVHVRDALTEHAVRVFKTHRLVALALHDRIALMTWDAIAGSLDLHGHLQALAADFPELRAIWLIDGSGQLRASSREFPVPRSDLSEYRWFEELRNGTGNVAVGRGGEAFGEDDYFTIAFRRGGSGAAFDGAIALAISPRYFRAFYSSAYPDDGLIALVHEDGSLLLRYPRDPSLPRRLAPDSEFFARTASSPTGLFAQVSTIDGASRLYGYARIGEMPIYLGFALGHAELLRLWRMRLHAYGIYFIPAGVALLLLALHAWRSHRDLEDMVDTRTAALSDAIAEKNQLLKEVHHRVKNNMQIISSLIRMQERVQTSPEETIRRVQAMALVHDLIYSHDAFASVDLAAYSRRLIESMRGTISADIAFDFRLEPVTVALDRAMPFALILSEVVTNASRHAFPEGRGVVAIALARSGDTIELCVHDDGQGFNAEVDGRGFGMRLVKSLAVQLGAEIAFARENGTTFRMIFPVEQPAREVAES